MELTLRALKSINLLDKVHTVKDGKEALDYIYTKGTDNTEKADRLKVIMLDLKLPKVSGLEVLKKLKSDERTKSIPIVVLTSSKESSDLKQCYELGVNSYIVKPFGLEDFVKAVSTAGLYWLVVNQPPRPEG
ncbi:MAG: response regulator [Thaumarchaeota archaeon]|nr:response regulator [Nitrososphaerota archaeon]